MNEWSDDDDDGLSPEAAAVKATWEPYRKEHPEYGGDPYRLLDAMRAMQAKGAELDAYKVWYEDYLRWKQSFDWESYAEYVNAQQPAQPIVPETPPSAPPTVRLKPIATIETPGPSTLPQEEHVWLWSDLDAVELAEGEVEAVGVIEQESNDEPLISATTAEIKEEPEPIATPSEPEPIAPDWRLEASLTCWRGWRQCMEWITRWLRRG